MKRTIAPLLLIAILAGCRGETVTTNTIENLSAKEIKFVLYRFGIARNDTIVVGSGMEKRISLVTTDRALDESPECAGRIDSAWVEVVGGGTLTKDISRNIFWESTSEEAGGIPREVSYSCVFTIRNSDITP